MSFKLKGVTFGYGGSKLFEKLDLEISPGEFVGLIGPNGAGKSTLLRLFAGLVVPEQGSVRVDGRAAVSLSRGEFARRVGLVLQESHFAFDYTVLDVVLMGRHAHLGTFERPSTTDREMALSVMARLGVAGLARQGINRVSSGERQRALVARALVQEPDSLLLDEVTSHLDIAHAELVMATLSELNRSGRAVVVSLHDLNTAALWCGRLVMLDRGRVVADGIPAEVIKPGLLAQVYGTAALVVTHPQAGRPQVLYPAPPL